MSTTKTYKKFYALTEYGEIANLCYHLQNLGHEVVLGILSKEFSKIGEGMIQKDDKWWNYIDGSYTFLVDGCNNGSLQEWLRAKGVPVFGGSEQGDRLENERTLGQKLFKMAGFQQVLNQNFKDFDSAIKFVLKNKDKKFVLKQNGDAPKSLNYMGKFDDNEDMLLHLEALKKSWSEDNGAVDFDMMEKVEGLEVAASALFNGNDWLRDESGKIAGYLSFEEKKSHDGGLGETCGEMGTTFIGTNEDNKLFKDIIVHEEFTKALKAAKFRGIFDVNCIKTKEGIVALEPTCRFGIPSTSYEFCEAMENPGEVLDSVAKGQMIPVKIKSGVGLVMVVVAKPFPLEADVENESTSIGKYLWILKDGKPVKNLDDEQKKHIHLYNFELKDDLYCVVTKSGYLLEVTGRDGKTILEVRNNLMEYIKNNIYIEGMVYRTDIGLRVEKYLGLEDTSKKTKEELKKEFDQQVENLKGEMENKVKAIEESRKQNLDKIKQTLKNQIYG